MENIKNTKNLSVARSELKYLLNMYDRLKLIRALDTLLIPDKYGAYNGYSVRSAYFDGVDNQVYTEKIKKFDFKKRIQIRAYTPDDQTAKFEIKKKWTHNQIKDSLIVSREDAQAMIAGNFEVLRKHDVPTAELGYHICTTMGYRPVSMVEYKRQAYTHPHFNTRITLDNNLEYTDSNFTLFGENINYKKVIGLKGTILDVKYDRFLFPQIQHVLAECDLQKCPISKFGSPRSVLQEFYY